MEEASHWGLRKDVSISTKAYESVCFPLFVVDEYEELRVKGNGAYIRRPIEKGGAWARVVARTLQNKPWTFRD